MLQFNKPQKNVSLSHPLVRDAYLVKDNVANHEEDVLVLETYHHHSEGGFDPYIVDLITDLEDLKLQAQKEIGHFDRIDICTH